MYVGVRSGLPLVRSFDFEPPTLAAKGADDDETLAAAELADPFRLEAADSASTARPFVAFSFGSSVMSQTLSGSAGGCTVATAAACAFSFSSIKERECREDFQAPSLLPDLCSGRDTPALCCLAGLVRDAGAASAFWFARRLFRVRSGSGEGEMRAGLEGVICEGSIERHTSSALGFFFVKFALGLGRRA
jgi:hypothetical protein